MIQPQEKIQGQFLLLGTSWCFLLAGLVAYHEGHYDLVHIPWGILITSNLYWSNPDNKWLRAIDMGYVQYCIWYQFYRALYSEYVIPYFMIKTTGLICYPLSKYFLARGQYLLSSYAHAFLHIFATTASTWMYMGAIDPPGPKALGNSA